MVQGVIFLVLKGGFFKILCAHNNTYYYISRDFFLKNKQNIYGRGCNYILVQMGPFFSDNLANVLASFKL